MTQHPGRRTDLSALADFAPELAATFVRLAGDIALVLDADGVIQSVELGGEPLAPSMQEWIGRSWVDTATLETRRKIEQLLKETISTGVSRRREVNHPSPGGVDIPVAWAAVRLGEQGRVLAVGRDLRAIAAIQQRFVEAQQQLERDYWKGRQTESRYSALFHVATDAVFVLDAESMAVVEANRAAAQLLDRPLDTLTGTRLPAHIDAAFRPAVEELLSQARASGRPAELRARLAGRNLLVSLSATPFRSVDAMLLLVRAHAVDASDAEPDRARLVNLVERLPDAVVITDSGGRVTMANPAFMELVGQPDEAGIGGRSLADWIAPIGTDFASVLAAVRRGGIVARLAARARAGRGHEQAVECAAVLLPEGDQECIGFTIRRAGTEVGAAARNTLSRLVEVLTVQMGTLDLPALLREVTDHAERHFLRAALQRANGRADEAARLLGINESTLQSGLLRLNIGIRDVLTDDAPSRDR